MRSDWLAQYLVQQADTLNHAYRLARQGDQAEFARSFSGFVLDALDPLLLALEPWPAANKAALAETAYQVGLTLVRRGWLAAEQRALTVELFTTVLPRWLAPYPADAPRLLVQLLNTLSHLPSAAQRGSLLEQWQRCNPAPDATPDHLLILGWMAGLPEFRSAAVTALGRQTALAEHLHLGEPEQLAHPWWQGTTAGWRTAPLEFGASTWLGGEFAALPVLLVAADQTLIQAGDDCWQLHADAWGHKLLAHTPEHADPVSIQDLQQLPPGLNDNWRSFDLARQCLERRYDWVVSFHNSFRIMIIPKVGGQP